MPPLVSKLIYWPTFLWNALLGRYLNIRNWWDELNDTIILGAVPLRSDIARLAHLGVTGIVNTCEEFEGRPNLYAEYGIQQLWIPTTDFNPPSLANVIRGVDFMHEQITSGGRVYVHCKAGRARSATVVICYLIQHTDLSPSEAQEFLLSKRPHVNRRLLQREVVQQFCSTLNENG